MQATIDSHFDDLSNALGAIADNLQDLPYSEWGAYGLAIKHDVLSGKLTDEEGFTLFDKFSQKAPGEYDAENTCGQWAGFRPKDDNPKTIRSIFDEAKGYGFTTAKSEPGDFSWVDRLPYINELPSGPEGIDVPYFDKRGIPTPIDARIHKGRSLIPYRQLNTGVITAVLSLSDDKKILLPDSKPIGACTAYYPITPDKVRHIILGEGVGTAAAVCESYDEHFGRSALDQLRGAEFSREQQNFIARQATTAILSVGSKLNLPPVAKWLRANHPTAGITILVDREAKAFCENLARTIPGVKLALVPIDAVPENAKADARDLWTEKGHKAVIDMINAAYWPRVEAVSDVQLPELSDMKVSDFIATKPPEQKYLLEGFLPEGVASAIMGAGGVGKSNLLLDLEVSVATGSVFAGGIATSSVAARKFGYDPDASKGGVLVLSAEDDRDEIHRRLHRICQNHLAGIEQARAEYGDIVDLWKEQYLSDIHQNLHILPNTGRSSRLISKGKTTSLLEQLIARGGEIGNLKLVVLDPLSRLHDGDENAAGPMTQVVEVLEQIKETLKVTVLVAHHVGKSAMLNNTRNQAAGRGSSALVDGLRLVMQLTAMSESDATEFGVNHREYLSLDITKSNYTAPAEPIWLRRGVGGQLTRAYLNVSEDDKKTNAIELIREEVSEACEAGRFYTVDSFLKEFSGTSGQFRLSRDNLRLLIKSAISSKVIYQMKAEILKQIYPSLAGQKDSTMMLVTSEKGVSN